MTMTVALRVNGKAVSVEADGSELLADVLRDRLGLYGTHLGCHEGVCGTCTVLLDGVPVRACLVLAGQADGSTVTTVEGLADGDALTPLQAAFVEHGAAQCGFCTPGMLVSATALLRDEPQPSTDRIREALAGNICRCTGYAKIVDAVLAARDGGRER
jgi:aerobic-type carbon monoxide dehydrogenase small subunit (CoxS/CutS family)